MLPWRPMESLPLAFDRNGALGLCRPEVEVGLDFFISGFEDWFEAQPKTVFLERPNFVAGVRLPGNVVGRPKTESVPVVVKRFGWRSPIHRAASLLASPRALRTFRIAWAVQAAGIPTPAPLIAWNPTDGSNGYFIAEEVEDAISFRRHLETLEGKESARQDALRRLADLVRRLHNTGFLHRDLTLGNFLVTTDGSAIREIFLIDLSRTVQMKNLPLLPRLIDLARIKVGADRSFFYAAYCADRKSWLAFDWLHAFLTRLRRGKVALRKTMKGRRGA